MRAVLDVTIQAQVLTLMYDLKRDFNAAIVLIPNQARGNLHFC
jgi:ABC-type dipeptide/oligopeptide/nickel transport system ATPase component